MAKGYALCVGLNAVDKGHYGGWGGELVACESDASDMETVLASRGFQVRKLLTRAATRQAVLQAIAEAARKMDPGDIFALTNSSHGGQVPDKGSDEPDGLDETICMYDGQIVDDELYAALGAFKRGARVLVISDSCHSGSMTRAEPADAAAPGRRPQAARGMPLEVQARTYYANRAFYDEINGRQAGQRPRDATAASILLISGCMDNQTSSDGPYNGLFTGTLLRVWNGGKFAGGYKKLWKQITRLMPREQSPNFFWATARDSAFEAQTPFTIDPGTPS
jgi:metacaspase-1